ncbi:AMP-binding protein [Mycolicibacterium thermoresistibile]
MTELVTPAAAPLTGDRRITERTPLPVLIEQRAAADPGGVAIECVDGGGYTNRELHDEATHLARGLVELGVQARDPVAVMLPTDPVAHVCWLAITWLRALEIPVNPDFRGNFLRHILSDSRPRVLITTAATLRQVQEVLGSTAIEHIVLVGATNRPVISDVRVSLYGELLQHGRYQPPPVPRPRDTYSVIYTSGTTGAAKGVVMPWASLHASALQIFPLEALNGDPAGAFYCPWPTFHSSGKIALYYAALAGIRVVMRRKFSVSSYWTDIRNHRCTHTHLIGLASALSAAPEAADDRDNPLQWVLMNPMPPDYRAFESRFSVRVSTGWGMTEIGFPVSSDDPPNHRTCGKLSPLFEARLVDEDDYDVPDGSPGEMVVRTREPWLLLESYLGRPDATATAWRNGWFHTGDVLRRDGDGYFYFVDRVSDYIRTRGNNVSSLEVEAEGAAHEEVELCACVGVPSDLSDGAVPDVATDQDIKLFVQRKPGSNLTESELLDFLSARMPQYMVPKSIEFVDAMPQTPTGKIRKAVLRQPDDEPGEFSVR